MQIIQLINTSKAMNYKLTTLTAALILAAQTFAGTKSPDVWAQCDSVVAAIREAQVPDTS